MDGGLTATQSLLGALVISLLLALLHLAAPRIRRLPLVPEDATGSFAGGLAVAYVFLHLLPELAEGNEAIGEALRDVVEPTPLLDLGIFLVALAGFTAFYGLERLAQLRAATGAGGREPVGVYWLHLSSFMVYNALITYTMALRLRTGVTFAILFVIAMGLHFVLTDGPSRSTTRDGSLAADGSCWPSPSSPDGSWTRCSRRRARSWWRS